MICPCGYRLVFQCLLWSCWFVKIRDRTFITSRSGEGGGGGSEGVSFTELTKNRGSQFFCLLLKETGICFNHNIVWQILLGIEGQPCVLTFRPPHILCIFKIKPLRKLTPISYFSYQECSVHVRTYANAYCLKMEKIYRFFNFLTAFLSLNWDKYFSHFLVFLW